MTEIMYKNPVKRVSCVLCAARWYRLESEHWGGRGRRVSEFQAMRGCMGDLSKEWAETLVYLCSMMTRSIDIVPTSFAFILASGCLLL